MVEIGSETENEIYEDSKKFLQDDEQTFVLVAARHQGRGPHCRTTNVLYNICSSTSKKKSPRSVVTILRSGRSVGNTIGDEGNLLHIGILG